MDRRSEVGNVLGWLASEDGRCLVLDEAEESGGQRRRHVVITVAPYGDDLDGLLDGDARCGDNASGLDVVEAVALAQGDQASADGVDRRSRTLRSACRSG